MEFKYVSRQRVWSGVIPFSSEARRFFGTGKIVEKKDNLVTEYHIKQFDSAKDDFILVGVADKVLSEIKDGDFVSFLEIEDVETSTFVTYVWKSTEFDVFIVNDNGKTVDRIVG
jgi:hypothetical protein